MNDWCCVVVWKLIVFMVSMMWAGVLAYQCGRDKILWRGIVGAVLVSVAWLLILWPTVAGG